MNYKKIVYAILTLLFVLLVYRNPYSNLFIGSGIEQQSFYFLNVFLVYGSFVFFMKTLYEIFNEKKFRKHILVGTLGLLYVTNYYVFTMSTLQAGEPFILFLVSLGLYILFTKEAKWGGKHILKTYVAPTIIPLTIFVLYILSMNSFGSNLRFSFTSVFDNISFYARSFFGGESRYLMSEARYLPNILGALSIIGLFIGILAEKHRSIVTTGLTFIASYILFVSFIASPDSRYILSLIPISLLVIGIVIHLFLKQSLRVGVFVILVILGIYFLDSSSSFRAEEKYITTLVEQISNNFQESLSNNDL